MWKKPRSRQSLRNGVRASANNYRPVLASDVFSESHGSHRQEKNTVPVSHTTEQTHMQRTTLLNPWTLVVTQLLDRLDCWTEKIENSGF